LVFSVAFAFGTADLDLGFVVVVFEPADLACGFKSGILALIFSFLFDELSDAMLALLPAPAPAPKPVSTPMLLLFCTWAGAWRCFFRCSAGKTGTFTSEIGFSTFDESWVGMGVPVKSLLLDVEESIGLEVKPEVEVGS